MVHVEKMPSCFSMETDKKPAGEFPPRAGRLGSVHGPGLVPCISDGALITLLLHLCAKKRAEADPVIACICPHPLSRWADITGLQPGRGKR